MTEKKEIQYFKEIMLDKKETLLALEKENNDQAKPVELDQTSVGRLSRMDAMQKQAMSLELKRRRQQELNQIEAALKRIEEDDYGYCFQCGEDINQNRLEINPTATLCIQCAETKENGSIN